MYLLTRRHMLPVPCPLHRQHYASPWEGGGGLSLYRAGRAALECLAYSAMGGILCSFCLGCAIAPLLLPALSLWNLSIPYGAIIYAAEHFMGSLIGRLEGAITYISPRRATSPLPVDAYLAL